MRAMILLAPGKQYPFTEPTAKQADAAHLCLRSAIATNRDESGATRYKRRLRLASGVWRVRADERGG